MCKAVAKVPELDQQKWGSEKRRIKVHMKEIGFHWSEEANQSFRSIKRAVLEIACHRGNPVRQYHLACHALGFTYRGVLFQLTDQPVGTVMSSKPMGAMRIIKFISKKFLDAETRYHSNELEGLAIVQCLEETRWHGNENRHPVLIYTNYECLKTALQNSDKGHIVGWLLRLSEYDFRIIHIKGKENALADGMSKLLIEAMEFGRQGKEESALEIMSANQPSNDKRWGYWLEDEWYAGVVYLKRHCKLHAEDTGKDSLAVWRWWTRKAAVYQLMDGVNHYPLLTYQERNGRQTWCVQNVNVNKVLFWAHDCHGHYSDDLTLKRLMGHYYWPTQMKDTHVF